MFGGVNLCSSSADSLGRRLIRGTVSVEESRQVRVRGVSRDEPASRRMPLQRVIWPSRLEPHEVFVLALGRYTVNAEVMALSCVL